MVALANEGCVHLLQYEREEAGALTGVLNRYKLHALFPLVALEAGLPRVLQVCSAQANPTEDVPVACATPACIMLPNIGSLWVLFVKEDISLNPKS